MVSGASAVRQTFSEPLWKHPDWKDRPQWETFLTLPLRKPFGNLFLSGFYTPESGLPAPAEG